MKQTIALWVGTCVACVAFTVPISALEAPTLPPRLTFESAKAQAQKDMQAEGFMKYGAVMVNQFGSAIQDRATACKNVSSAPKPKKWGIVVRIAADGRVEDAWVDPQTDAALSCVADKMKTARFDKPPFGPLHFFVDMTTNQK